MIFQRSWRGFAPPWFQARWISTIYESIGAVLDTEGQRAMDGRLAAIPYAGAGPGAAKLSSGQRIECQPDALPYHFSDRQLRAYDTEPMGSKRFRCSRWRQLHATRGTHRGEHMNMQPYFLGAAGAGPLPTIRTVHRIPGATTWHATNGAGAYSVYRGPDNFDYATGDDAKWSQFYVIVEMSEAPQYTPPARYGEGHLYGDGTLYGAGGGSPLTAAAQQDLVSMILDWKSAHSWLTAFILNWGPPIDITATPVQDAYGRWSMPNGKWYPKVDPSTGHATRPGHLQWIYESIPT